jgi:O-antigen/teichoic acid export membrane protein
VEGLSDTAVSERTSRFKLLVDERLLSHNLIVGAGTMVAGVMGVAFQSAASHQLRPADYGAVFVVVTLVTFIGMPASAFTLLMAREASRDLATGGFDRSATLLRHGNRALLKAGLVIAAVLAIGSPVLSSFLGASPQLLLAAAVGVPFGVALPLLLGEFQGNQRFVAFATLAAGQATLKLVTAIALGLVFGPTGVIAGISVATVAVYAAALWMLRSKRVGHYDAALWRPAAAYLAVILPSTLALALLLSTDVVLVKHYFGAREAGEYSVVAAIGRAIFWGSAGIATVLFPKIVFRSAKGQRASLVLVSSLLLVSLGGLVALGILTTTSKWLLTAFAGHSYVGGATYLPWYAIGMTLLGATAVLIAAHQSQGRSGFLYILLPLAALEPILIGAFHQTLVQVVQVVNVSMTLPTVGLAAWYVIQERGARPSVAPGPVPATAQLQASR